MDPYLEADDIQHLKKPMLPKQSDITSEKVTPSNDALTPMESATFQDLLNEYKKNLAEYNTQRSSINTLSSYIIETISSLHQPSIQDCDSEYKMLTTLMNRVAPTDRARSIELIKSWKKALKAGKKQNQEIWLANLEKLQAQCTKVKLPEIQGHRPLFDFLHAVSNINTKFAGYWEGWLSEI